MIRFTVVAAALLALTTADPQYCRERATPYMCITPLFTPDLLQKLTSLQGLNVLSLVRMQANELDTKLAVLDAFCNPLMASTQCGKANVWWECKRDINAVTTMINSVLDQLNGEGHSSWHMSPDSILHYMRYAGLVCSSSTGLRSLLSDKQCILNSIANSSPDIQSDTVNQLNGIFGAGNFSGFCELAQRGMHNFMGTLATTCPTNTTDVVWRFLSSSFTIIPGFNPDNCQINRTRPDEIITVADNSTDVANNETADAVTYVPPLESFRRHRSGAEPDFCESKTSAAKFQCYAQTLTDNILKSIPALDGISPVMLANLDESQLSERLSIVHAFCDLLNATEQCTNNFWQCKSDMEAVTSVINGFQDVLNGPGHDEWHLSSDWLRRHFVYASYICVGDDLLTLQTNVACVRDAMTSVQPVVDRLSGLFSSNTPFNATEQCDSAKADVVAVAKALGNSCKGQAASVNHLITNTFELLEGYSDEGCNFLAELTL